MCEFILGNKNCKIFDFFKMKDEIKKKNFVN